MGLLLLSAGTAFAQQTVRGRVTTSADAQPIAGVQVVVRNTSTIAITDGEGRYSINVAQPAAAVLDYSFMGYAPVEQTVGSRTEINVQMTAEATEIDDVVVIGYTTVRRATLTSSVVTLGSESIAENTSSDLGSMLQGKVAGMLVTNSTGQPGSQANIMIRGVGTITAGQDPLYVVDGIPGGSYNPNDVETITILKDVGSTAIYGADGANGVVVITTKTGRRNQAPVFTVTAKTAVTQPLWGRFSVADSRELYEFYEGLGIPNFEAEYPRTLLDTDFDWLGETYSNGSAQDVSASVTGGTQNTTYMVSLDYYNQKGALEGTFFKRKGARMNFNTQLLRNLDLTVRMNMSENSRGNTWGFIVPEMAYRGFPWDNPFGDDGKAIDIANIPTSQMAWHYVNRQNSFHGGQWNYDKSGGVSMGLDFVVNWNILPSLAVTNTTRMGRNTSWSKAHYDARDSSQVHNGATLGNRNEESTSYPLPSYRNTTLLKYNKVFGNHDLNAVAGYEISQSQGNYRLGASANGLPNGMDVISTGNQNSMRISSGWAIPSAGWSAFGQLSYAYANKYLATVTFRADASTKFAPNNRVGYFPAVSAGWVVSQEEFMKNISWLDYLKVRASYGLTGNSNIGDFAYLDTYRFGVSYSGEPGAEPARLANPNLGWETATMLSGGIDFTIFKRVEASLDLYHNVNRDLLFDAPIPPHTGFYSNTRNIGSVSNRGIEFSVTSTNVSNRDWNWTTSFNISHNKNRIESLPGEDPENPGHGAPIMVGGSDRIRQRMEEGYELYSWYMPKWMGVNPEDGAPQWLAEDGSLTSVYDDAPDMWLGSASPDFTAGLTNTVTWKGLSLGVNLYMVSGGLLSSNGFPGDGGSLQYNQSSINNGLGWTRWQKPGDVADLPRAYRGNPSKSGSPSSRTLVSGTFLRVRNINLGYSIPQSALEHVGLQTARVFLSGDNLFTITKFPGADPETTLSSSGIDGVAGSVGMRYPLYRTFTLGLELSF
jgi:TonB-linked SusC/RagA family outer membrane protein